MLNSPKVSLIISNFNGKNMLIDCLNSLRALDYPNYEIIVVDAGSTDGTPEMIESKFPEVILVKEKKRIGVGEAINIGIANSKGEIIGFDLNNDEIFSKDWLGILVNEILSTDEKKVVGGTRLIYNSDNIVDSAGVKWSFLGDEMQIGRGKRLSEISLTIQEVDYVGCPIFHVSLLEEMRAYVGALKVLDEKYYFYFEDSDFCERARELGYKIINVYSAISYHRRSATVTSESAKSYYFLKRGKLRFMVKHFSMSRLFFSSIWWLLRGFYDALKYSNFTQNFFLYSGLQITRWKPTGNAFLKAIYWNILNIRDHFRGRAVTMVILNEKKIR